MRFSYALGRASILVADTNKAGVVMWRFEWKNKAEMIFTVDVFVPQAPIGDWI